ncbi:hypothetical protein BOTBODRAFT_29830 [Botryobasidium botryosum FD-172 SS1]|uniref:Proline dehydrogenase n=1 Tax=Botryobasidium botryosum (strain FD-172 SS1) TaxID=930990 RepID=A0A067MQ14_BOTB1|nr:hypothetical protein BOTBODRAFT_29830 [Botryobasidium botryosum FD-172 SS1]
MATRALARLPLARSYVPSSPAFHFSRRLYTTGPTLRPRFFRPTPIFFGTSLLAAVALVTYQDGDDEKKREIPRASMTSLVRSYVVYTMCSIPSLVDYSPTILSTLQAIPGIKQVTETVVRHTFFAQFVGGDSAAETVPLIEALRRQGKGVLLGYSVEVDEAAASGKPKSASGEPVGYKRNVLEMMRSVDVVGEFEDSVGAAGNMGRSGGVALKLTALLPSAESLKRFSTYLLETRPPLSAPVAYPGVPHSTDLAILTDSTRAKSSLLTAEDITTLKDLYEDLRQIAIKAKQRGVKLIIDAEHTHYQPAIDAFVLALTREFNVPSQSSTVQPLIYGTYQAYLRRTPKMLEQSLEEANRGGYALGVKLVRGAYHSFETARYASLPETEKKDSSPPVWESKDETDRCYNLCASRIISAIKDDITVSKQGKKAAGGAVSPRIGIIFATHNKDSCERVLEGLVREGLALREDSGKVKVGVEVAERVMFGQLLGMCDSLTEYIAGTVDSPSPFVFKYIPYGPLSEVLPYLSRRAIENKSVLGGRGGAADERRQAKEQIWQRLFG